MTDELDSGKDTGKEPEGGEGQAGGPEASGTLGDQPSGSDQGPGASSASLDPEEVGDGLGGGLGAGDAKPQGPVSQAVLDLSNAGEGPFETPKVTPVAQPKVRKLSQAHEYLWHILSFVCQVFLVLWLVSSFVGNRPYNVTGLILTLVVILLCFPRLNLFSVQTKAGIASFGAAVAITLTAFHDFGVSILGLVPMPLVWAVVLLGLWLYVFLTVRHLFWSTRKRFAAIFMIVLLYPLWGLLAAFFEAFGPAARAFDLDLLNSSPALLSFLPWFLAPALFFNILLPLAATLFLFRYEFRVLVSPGLSGRHFAGLFLALGCALLVVTGFIDSTSANPAFASVHKAMGEKIPDNTLAWRSGEVYSSSQGDQLASATPGKAAPPTPAKAAGPVPAGAGEAAKGPGAEGTPAAAPSDSAGAGTPLEGAGAGAPLEGADAARPVEGAGAGAGTPPEGAGAGAPLEGAGAGGSAEGAAPGTPSDGAGASDGSPGLGEAGEGKALAEGGAAPGQAEAAQPEAPAGAGSQPEPLDEASAQAEGGAPDPATGEGPSAGQGVTPAAPAGADPALASEGASKTVEGAGTAAPAPEILLAANDPAPGADAAAQGPPAGQDAPQEGDTRTRQLPRIQPGFSLGPDTTIYQDKENAPSPFYFDDSSDPSFPPKPPAPEGEGKDSGLGGADPALAGGAALPGGDQGQQGSAQGGEVALAQGGDTEYYRALSEDFRRQLDDLSQQNRFLADQLVSTRDQLDRAHDLLTALQDRVVRLEQGGEPAPSSN